VRLRAGPDRDCEDASASIHPGAADDAGDHRPGLLRGRTPPPRVTAVVSYRWELAQKWSRVLELTIRNAPANAKAIVSCKGGGGPFARLAVTLRAAKRISPSSSRRAGSQPARSST
jgi:hypothetical protein